MREKRITQDKLAELLDMTQGGVQHWLSGTRQPSLDEINRLAAAIGVPGAFLSHGVTSDDLATDLPEPARGVIRRLIQLQRSGTAPATLWPAIESVITLGSGGPEPQPPLGAPIAPEHEAHLRELSIRGEEAHQRRPGRRVSSG